MEMETMLPKGLKQLYIAIALMEKKKIVDKDSRVISGLYQ